MTSPTHPPRFHVIVILNSGAQQIEACLCALLAQSLPPAWITVFDNASLSDAADRIARDYPRVRLMRSPCPLGFAAGNNRAAASVREADQLLLLDADAVPALDALERFAEIFARHPGVGVLGCKVLDRDVETIRHLGLELSANGLICDLAKGEPDRGQYRGLRETQAVQIAAMAVRADTWAELGGLDESFFPVFYEGIDLCLRARAQGWRVAVACDATVTHFNPWTPRRTDPQELNILFRARARYLFKHTRGRAWLTDFLPAELRWLADLESKGMRRIALRTLLGAACRHFLMKG